MSFTIRTFVTFLMLASPVCAFQGSAWTRHTIDASSRGADGARPKDVNLDGRLDLVTGWEEGGVIRAYLHPGPEKARQPWPAVTVGRVKSPEDAVYVDLDGDGASDVVSSCEGRTQSVFFHWAPKKRSQFLDEDLWKTEPVPATAGKQRWMFALPLNIDGRNGIDLIVGSKNPNAAIGWLESPGKPRDVSAWRFHKLRDAGWIMSLIAFDMDRDLDLDLVASDRKGPHRGVFWLENPGTVRSRKGEPWIEHWIGGRDLEAMFIDVTRKNIAGPQQPDIVVALASRQPATLTTLTKRSGPLWSPESNPVANVLNIGTPKSVRRADIDGDGEPDLVMSCENATGSKSGVVWFPRGNVEQRREISGPQGVKFDLVELIDIDEDGDLDVVTCEERANLGVIWYENPTR